MSTPTPAWELRARAYELQAEAFALLASAERAEHGDRSDAYTTRKGEEPPAFRTRHRGWVAIAPTIPGARRASPGSRWYVVSREAYEQWTAARAPTEAPPQANDTDGAWSPASALAASGMRLSR